MRQQAAGAFCFLMSKLSFDPKALRKIDKMDRPAPGDLADFEFTLPVSTGLSGRSRSVRG